MTQTSMHEAKVVPYFSLLLTLAVPIWLLSRFVGVIGSLKIPITDLALAFTPMIAACILVFRSEGVPGLTVFLKRAVAFRSLAASRWFAAVLLLAPSIYVLTALTLRFTGHAAAPRPDLARLILLAAIMLALAIGEEAGWTGYLLDPLQARFGALGASLVIAVPWWLGHVPSILEIGGGPSDLAWWIPGAIALRVLMTWLYNNTGRSVAAVVLFHTLLNVGRAVSYPTIGSHYDPVYQATGYGIAFGLAAIVVMVWGSKRLSWR